MDYLEWNDAIGERFFNAERSGIRVFLYVTNDVVTDVGSPKGVGVEDFILAVKSGPPWNTRHGWGLCQQALQTLENWRDRKLKYPPYLAYLALFVLADTIEVEGFARYSYYPGLRQVLGEEPAAGSYPSFDKMYELWFDLEEWSNSDANGELGIFRADILGKREYVGLPKAQTILTDDERHKLPLLFDENGFDPSSPPSDRELSHLLSHEAHHYLLPHTKRLLANSDDAERAVREVLLDAILEELYNWDGTVPPQPEMGAQEYNSVSNLRLVMNLDHTAQTARFSVRCKSNSAYPEEGLQLTGAGIEKALYCYEDWQGWSTPLFVDETQGCVFDPACFDWEDGLALIDNEHAWKTALSKRSVKVMISALPFGFDGFIEHFQIPQDKPFYLLIKNDCREKIIAWGNKSCERFLELERVYGLPHGWSLFSIERANSDVLIRDSYPSLAFPNVLRIQLRGGLKVRGTQYFAFALPQIEVAGPLDGANVFCNDHQLKFNPETGVYSIPNTLCARRFIIEIRRDGKCIRRRSIYTLDSVAWRDADSTVCLNKFGQRVGCDAPDTCTGVIVNGFTPPDFDPGIFLPPSAGHRVYYIGRNLGEIVECPNETIPEDWQPVWAIMMHKRGKGTAVYCGADPDTVKPGITGCKDQKKLRQWRDVLWHRRKRIACPPHPALRSLWRRYQEVAHRVRRS